MGLYGVYVGGELDSETEGCSLAFARARIIPQAMKPVVRRKWDGKLIREMVWVQGKGLVKLRKG